MFPKETQSDMTIYNLYEDSSGLRRMQPTILSGVFWQGNYGANLTAKGIVTTDKVAVMILKDIRVEGKSYIAPLGFMKLPQDEKSLYWTIAKGDKLIHMAVTDLVSKASELDKKYGFDNVFTVTSIVFNDFGSTFMRHFKVIGK